ncbi:hypothetical protein [Herbaspirillum sp. ST 5-3]|uniref:hypothetical protein n=1 Tax=Oxalobacteraceae TaxID=75682 RepID=UPI0010A324F1|nr:hypothetical protein [Herbaspirillum sp. ST 5-3]
MSMQATMSLPTKTSTATPLAAKRSEDTIGTRVWLDEYTFLQSVYHSADNCSPKFRLPDLISACVSLVFLGPDPAQCIFSYLHAEMILRDQNSIRRQEEMWMPQYQLLLGLQRSPSNCHPHPQFKLDHFTTACIALVSAGQDVTHRILEQARHNTAERAARRLHAEPLNQ